MCIRDSPGSRLQTPSFATASSGAGSVPEQGRLPRASSRPASLGPAGSTQDPRAGGVPVVEINTPPRSRGSP
eukprot:6011944-Alexandrium_andersonii.AAC.1